MKNPTKKRHIHLSLRVFISGILLVWSISIFATWFLTREFSHHIDDSFPLLNDRLKYEDLDSIEDRRAKLFTNLVPLKDEILNKYQQEKENFAFYIEDLNSGSWTGWQEKEPFITASLLKVPIAIATMKKIDKGDWTLDTSFRLEENLKDKGFGELWKEPVGTSFTVERLLSEMIQKSDNTSFRMLVNKLSNDEITNLNYHIGVSDSEMRVEVLSTGEKVGKLYAKELASTFRALYNATYLTRKSSNYILDLLTKTKFSDNVSDVIPANIPVAHKIAAFDSADPNRPKNYHDCGITYIPEHPYLYCIMTQNYGSDKSEEIITGIGEMNFIFFESGTTK